MAGVVELEIPARREYLSLARLVVATSARIEPTFRDARIDDLRIAVSEATTNAIEAQTDAASIERIKIRCNLQAESVEVEVEDRGPGFSSDEDHALPDLDEAESESGFGIPLMRILADEADIRPSDEGTAVRLVVYRRSRG